MIKEKYDVKLTWIEMSACLVWPLISGGAGAAITHWLFDNATLGAVIGVGSMVMFLLIVIFGHVTMIERELGMHDIEED